MSAEETRRLEEQRTEERLLAGLNPIDPTFRAREAVARYWNDGAEKYGDERVDPLTDLYIVSFSYILGGWKAMVSSDAWTDTSYFEVTYNFAAAETYVDHYRKVNNKKYPDSDDFKLAMLREKLSR